MHKIQGKQIFLSKYILSNILIIFIFQTGLQSSEDTGHRRSIDAVRTFIPPVIDGTLRDEAWHAANVASGFFQHEPHNDRPASYDTEVRVLYDDNALYVAAKMFDPDTDEILREMGIRNSGDNLNADRFYIDINPFNDGINGFRFQVSASGVQTDSNLSGGGSRGDVNWDAVWVSRHSITDNGWIVEMMIPYSALRFPKGNIQEWGINFWREIRRKREISSWNYVDRRIGDALAFMGVLNGISDVQPPLRLALYPYISNYVENNGYDAGWTNTLNGGMDLKWGISPAFTMDMTLIPDFGQVQSDAKILNLSPYEIKYDENRQFFTEGTELFSKADLFYSRRIGAQPRNFSSVYHQKEDDEIVKINPLETRLINATKISGRTAAGLGAGFFNAMTAASKAIIKDTVTGDTRKITTQGFTNYNLIVLDQSLRNNSYISLINTIVTGSEKGYTANVTGTEFRFNDQSNMFRIIGSGALSQQYFSDQGNNYGYKYSLRAGKFGGTWQYNYSRNVISNRYDQNDMGFLRRNNQINDQVSISHNIFVPFWRLWSLTNLFSFNYSRLYKPNTFTGMQVQYTLRALFDTRFFINLSTTYSPRGERDYFEPRVAGRFYRTDDSYNIRLTWSSDYRKRLFFDGNMGFNRLRADTPQDEYGFMIQPTFRFSDRLNMSYRFEYNKKNNDIGYVKHQTPDIIYFGRRNSPTVTNSVRASYIFSNNLSLNFNLRHYWSTVEYNGNYYLLNPDGRLKPFENHLEVDDINYNAFTIDLLLTWHFAPGSQVSIAWKNIIDSRHGKIFDNYFDNLEDLLGRPQINSLSVRLLYYIDYQSIQRLL